MEQTFVHVKPEPKWEDDEEEAPMCVEIINWGDIETPPPTPATQRPPPLDLPSPTTITHAGKLDFDDIRQEGAPKVADNATSHTDGRSVLTTITTKNSKITSDNKHASPGTEEVKKRTRKKKQKKTVAEEEAKDETTTHPSPTITTTTVTNRKDDVEPPSVVGRTAVRPGSVPKFPKERLGLLQKGLPKPNVVIIPYDTLSVPSPIHSSYIRQAILKSGTILERLFDGNEDPVIGKHLAEFCLDPTQCHTIIRSWFRAGVLQEGIWDLIANMSQTDSRETVREHLLDLFAVVCYLAALMKFQVDSAAKDASIGECTTQQCYDIVVLATATTTTDSALPPLPHESASVDHLINADIMAVVVGEEGGDQAITEASVNEITKPHQQSDVQHVPRHQMHNYDLYSACNSIFQLSDNIDESRHALKEASQSAGVATFMPDEDSTSVYRRLFCIIAKLHDFEKRVVDHLHIVENVNHFAPTGSGWQIVPNPLYLPTWQNGGLRLLILHQRLRHQDLFVPQSGITFMSQSELELSRLHPPHNRSLLTVTDCIPDGFREYAFQKEVVRELKWFVAEKKEAEWIHTNRSSKSTSAQYAGQLASWRHVLPWRHLSEDEMSWTLTQTKKRKRTRSQGEDDGEGEMETNTSHPNKRTKRAYNESKTRGNKKNGARPATSASAGRSKSPRADACPYQDNTGCGYSRSRNIPHSTSCPSHFLQDEIDQTPSEYFGRLVNPLSRSTNSSTVTHRLVGQSDHYHSPTAEADEALGVYQMGIEEGLGFTGFSPPSTSTTTTTTMTTNRKRKFNKASKFKSKKARQTNADEEDSDDDDENDSDDEDCNPITDDPDILKVTCGICGEKYKWAYRHGRCSTCNVTCIEHGKRAKKRNRELRKTTPLKLFNNSHSDEFERFFIHLLEYQNSPDDPRIREALACIQQPKARTRNIAIESCFGCRTGTRHCCKCMLDGKMDPRHVFMGLMRADNQGRLQIRIAYICSYKCLALIRAGTGGLMAVEEELKRLRIKVEVEEDQDTEIPSEFLEPLDFDSLTTTTTTTTTTTRSRLISATPTPTPTLLQDYELSIPIPQLSSSVLNGDEYTTINADLGETEVEPDPDRAKPSRRKRGRAGSDGRGSQPRRVMRYHYSDSSTPGKSASSRDVFYIDEESLPEIIRASNLRNAAYLKEVALEEVRKREAAKAAATTTTTTSTTTTTTTSLRPIHELKDV